jgi:hypothetical protein
MAVNREQIEERENARRRKKAQRPALGAQLSALRREAQKDVNQTLNQVFFGQQSGQNELGTPLAPTSQQVTEGLENRQVSQQTDRIAAPQAEKKEGQKIEAPKQKRKRGMER